MDCPLLTGGLEAPPLPGSSTAALRLKTHYAREVQASVTTKEASTDCRISDRLVAERYARSAGLYLGKMDVQEQTFWGHVHACMRLPRGGVNGAGSQECSFEYQPPSQSVLEHLMETLPFRPREVWGGQEGWVASRTIDTYWAFDRHTLDHFLRLHKRESLQQFETLYRGSKLIRPSTRQRASVMLSVCPPLLIEVCHRTGGRTVMVVSFKLFLLNEAGGTTMPPQYQYANGMDAIFRTRSMNHLAALVQRGIVLPEESGFHALLQQHSAVASDSEASEEAAEGSELGWPVSPEPADSDSASDACLDSDMSADEEVRREPHTASHPRGSHMAGSGEA